MRENAKTWVEVTEPIIRRFEVGAKFGKGVHFNPEGSKAMAELMKSMSRRLDVAVERENQRKASRRLLRLFGL